MAIAGTYDSLDVSGLVVVGNLTVIFEEGFRLRESRWVRELDQLSAGSDVWDMCLFIPQAQSSH